MHVVADRHPAHRSKVVRSWLRAGAERVELHPIPGYSPEANPDEPLGANLKRNVNAFCARNLHQLVHEPRRFPAPPKWRPHSVRGPATSALHTSLRRGVGTEHLRFH